MFEDEIVDGGEGADGDEGGDDGLETSEASGSITFGG